MSTKGDSTEPQPGRVRKLSVISKLHANLNRVDKYMGTWMYCLLWFDHDVHMDTVRKCVRERLLTIPRFRSCLKESKRRKETFVELSLDEIDMDHHVRLHPEEWTLEKVMEDFVDDQFKNFEFNLDAPLWQVNYFPKVGARSLCLFTVNHSYGDGVSIVEVLYRLMDPKIPKDKSGSGSPEALALEGASAEPASEGPEGSDDAMVPGKNVEPLKKASSVDDHKKRHKAKSVYGPLNKARIFLSGVLSPFGEVLWSKTDTPSPLMRAPGTGSQLRSTTFTDVIPLAKVKEVKSRYPGATINDVLVTLLQLTLKAYFEQVVAINEDPAKTKGAQNLLHGKGLMRASFPISVRKRGADGFKDGSPHNKIALGSLSFRFKSSSRAQLLHDTKRVLDATKLSPEPFVQQSLANNLIRVLSKEKITALFKKAGETTTAMLSNVPGPLEKARFEGHVVDEISFALHGGPSLYLGLISYAGDISCCVCLDKSLGDAKNVAKHWLPEFNKLYEEVTKHGDAVPNLRKKCFDKY